MRPGLRSSYSRSPATGLLLRLLAGWMLVGSFLGCAPNESASVEKPTILLLTAGGWSADPSLYTANPPSDAPAAPEIEDWLGTAVIASSEPLASLASIHTGVGVWQHQLLASTMAVERTDISNLAERLTQLGYQTMAWVPPPFRRRHLLSQGFAQFEDPSRAAATLPGYLATATSPSFHWLHLTMPVSNGEAGAERLTPEMWSWRVEQRLEQLLATLDAEARQRIVVIALGTHGWPAAGRSRLHRSSLEVPLEIRMPSALRNRLMAEPGQRVAATRLWATLIEVAGGSVEPARAPSLFRPQADPILSETYFSAGQNYFSLVEGDWQLRWVTRYASQANVAAANRAALRRQFLDTQPLYGAGVNRPLLHLERWIGAGSQVAEDPARRRQLAAALERIWLRHTDPWQTPRDIIRETNPRPKKALAERGAEADR